MPERVAVVTGGAGAVGAAVADQLARSGVSVAVADLNLDAAVRVVDALPRVGDTRHLAILLDVRQPESIESAVQVIDDSFGRLDIVVNNAGISIRTGLADLSLDEWDQSLGVNLRGPLLVCKGAMPLWTRQHSGSVVNITSRAWNTGGAPSYVASKAGLVGLTRSLATSLAPLGVTANAVAPSYLMTELSRQGRDEAAHRAEAERFRRMTPLKRIIEPVDVAKAVAFLCSDGARNITGEVLHVCGGSQLAPLTSIFDAASDER